MDNIVKNILVPLSGLGLTLYDIPDGPLYASGDWQGIFLILGLILLVYYLVNLLRGAWENYRKKNN